ncbi:MAG: copper-binding protein [Woeseia sp.]
MKHRAIPLTTAAITALLLAGCAEEAPNTGSTGRESGGMRNMPGMQQPAQDGAEHVAQGTVNSVDAASDTVNISHEPVESIGWPAMTMNFQLADPNLATQLRPGQRVEFTFRAAEGSATVTDVSPVDETD